ncbi:MAG: phosphodiester glycosidase family protein [Hyphomicrobiales bacterium]|nr:phosphodiester glycosidase family protein [Hyphomicrobiales bacterium]
MSALWDLLFSLFCGILGLCPPDSCREMSHAGSQHIVCSYTISDISMKLYLNDAEGVPYGRFSKLEPDLGQSPTMLMNGGMYHDDLSAVGLYVEGRQQQKGISTKGGWGNFHLLPNGVFWIKGDQVGVTETKQYLARKIRPDYATQSGPMLVIDGKLHHRFLKDSDSRKIRNGVGISADGKTIHFAISKGSVTFWDFGKLFQERLKTPNALFLDGTVSAIRTDKFRRGGWRQLGPMIAVFKK